MNLQNVISEIEKVDPEVLGRLDTRRKAMKEFGNLAGKLALAAVPFAMGSMFTKAYGRNTSTTATILEVLNYALTLEYLEAEFYQRGNAVATTLIPNAADRTAMATIGAHETAHVAFLKSAITASGGTPVAKPTFDFTAKGTFPDVFTNYVTFLAVSQTFEDTGVRAYKGAAGDLISNNDVLTAALNIHSVEARHAAKVRMMRKMNGHNTTIKSWITLNQSGIGSAAVQPSYNGEEVTTQAGIVITNINGKSISAEAASEAFDEPLTMAQVLAIAGNFIA